MRAFIVQIDNDDLDPTTMAQELFNTLTDDGFTVIAVNPWGPAPTIGVPSQNPPEVQGLIPPL